VVRLEWLALGYVAIGVLIAARARWRGERLVDAALFLLAWPLYLPVWQSRAEPVKPEDPADRAAERVRDALSSVEKAAADTAFAGLLDASAGLRLRQELARATQRVHAIDHELAQQQAGSLTSSATLHLRAESEASLRAIRDRDLRAMLELAELLGALRTRIVLAQHSGGDEGPEGMVSEVWDRIVGLGEAMEEGPRRAPSTARGVAAPDPA
jgi:hypothetical protein